MIYIGSARIDENGNLSGGKAGDQKQSAVPDMKGEVSQQKFYVHKKGWYILRAKDKKVAQGIADAMIRACNNPKIGYSQSDRNGIIKNGTRTSTPTNCDCSSLIRQCIKEASGKDVGNFNTSTEKATLLASGLFVFYIYYEGTPLYKGDVLVTKTKGHTAAVTSGDTVTTNTRPTIRFGSKGPDVKYLHQQLKKLKYGVNPDSDYFDSTTKNCVIHLQASNYIETDGVVGPITWKIVESL